MASTSTSTPTPKRVVVRAHEHWYDEYQSITQDWFRWAGYSTSGEVYDWTTHHYVHLGGLNGGRFHLIIDIGANACTSPQMESLPIEIYRLRKPQGTAS